MYILQAYFNNIWVEIQRFETAEEAIKATDEVCDKYPTEKFRVITETLVYLR